MKERYMKHLYARISTDDKGQDISTQLHLVNSKHKVDMTWTDEGVRGKSNPLERDGFRSMFSVLMPGDTIYVMEISRISRDTITTLNLYQQLGKMGVKVVSLADGEFDLSDPDDMFRLTIFAGLNQRESGVMGRRISIGMQRAKAQGVELGRKTTGDKAKAAQMLSEGCTVAAIVSQTGVSRATVFRMKKEIIGQEAA